MLLASEAACLASDAGHNTALAAAFTVVCLALFGLRSTRNLLLIACVVVFAAGVAKHGPAMYDAATTERDLQVSWCDE